MKSPPSYRRHSSGRATISVRTTAGARKEIMLGAWQSPESLAEYRRVLEVLERNNGLWPVGPKSIHSISVNEMVLDFLQWAEKSYPRSREYEEHKRAADPLVRLYGSLPVGDFTVKKLRDVRDAMVKHGWSRGTINRHIGRVRHIFKWATAEELIPPHVYAPLPTLVAIPPLTQGVNETTPRKPAFWKDVEQVAPHCPPPVAAMLRLQALTGMRSGEVRSMRPLDIDTSDPECWQYRPGSDAGPFGRHKNAHRGQLRIVPLGPQCIEILRPWMADRQPDEYLFNPARWRRQQWDARSAKRKTRPTRKQADKMKRSKVKPIPNRQYSMRDYPQAVNRACRAVGIEFSPYCLRHGAKMTIARQFGLEAARQVLGQKSIQTTIHYGSLDLEFASDVMKQIG